MKNEEQTGAEPRYHVCPYRWEKRETWSPVERAGDSAISVRARGGGGEKDRQTGNRRRKWHWRHGRRGRHGRHRRGASYREYVRTAAPGSNTRHRTSCCKCPPPWTSHRRRRTWSNKRCVLPPISTTCAPDLDSSLSSRAWLYTPVHPSSLSRSSDTKLRSQGFGPKHPKMCWKYYILTLVGLCYHSDPKTLCSSGICNQKVRVVLGLERVISRLRVTRGLMRSKHRPTKLSYSHLATV